MKCLIFDLDGTLYDSKDLDEQNRRILVQLISEHHSISMNEALYLLESKQRDATRTGAKTSLLSATVSLGIPKETIFNAQSSGIDPYHAIGRDSELEDLLQECKLKHKLSILTNTESRIVQKVLTLLFVRTDLFDCVLAGGDTEDQKPNINNLLEICSKLNVAPNECVVFGDRQYVDIDPAIEIGMTGVLVSGRNDLIQQVKLLMDPPNYPVLW